MRITIVANGSRGDVQPFVALGVGLRAAGYDVTLATATPFGAAVAERGLPWADLEADPRAILQDELGHAWLEAGHNPVAFFTRLRPIAAPAMERFFDATLRACEGADAVVFSPLGVPAWHVAEARGTPAVLATLIPQVPTATIPHPLAPALPLGRAWNRLSWRFVDQLAWRMFRAPTNQWREALGLRPLPLRGPFRELTAPGELVLGAFSRHVAPRPADWPAAARVTGYWFLDRPHCWQPPNDLERFLAAGEPPVYVGLGSMTGRDPVERTALVVEALRMARRRGVLLSGWAGLGDATAGDDVIVVDDIPHDWLFPRMSAVVHHGGAGTTAAGLRAGRPSVLLPFFADQPFWGRRVADLGAGPPPIPQKRLTAENLAAAIHAATADPLITSRARDLGERIRAEDGVATAVRLLAHHFDATLSRDWAQRLA